MYRAPQHVRTYFVTTTTANRRRLFQVEANARLLMDVLEEQRQKQRFHLHAFVVMPDHLHAIVTPAPDVSLEKAVQFIKGSFSYRLKSRSNVWTPSFNQTQVLDSASFKAFRNYIHQNPVRANLVEKAESFSYSSAGRDHLINSAPAHLQAGAEAPADLTSDSRA